MALAQPDPSDRKKQSPFNAYLKYSGLAVQLLATLALFGWLGYRLDQWLALKFPAFMLLFGLMAFVGMMYQVYRSMK